MDKAADDFIHAGSLSEIKAKGMVLVRGGPTPILVVHDGGRLFALDNRCPHLGFPLNQGSVEDGILTCHWHHARFDLSSGCTFDLWADDVPAAEVRIDGDEVWVSSRLQPAGGAGRWRQRLHDGMSHNIPLVMGKAILAGLDAGASHRDIVAAAADYGVRNRDGFDIGMTILTALGNIIDRLPEDEAFLALFHGVRRVAADCAGEEPYQSSGPLLDADLDGRTLKRWLRQWSGVRHRTAAERTLETMISSSRPWEKIVDGVAAAATDRHYGDTGHSLDFVNKALEAAELVGHDRALAILPTAIDQMVRARGGEESDSWRHPVDLVALVDAAWERVRGRLPDPGGAGTYKAHADLAARLLGDEPDKIVSALEQAVGKGARAADLARALAYAAALRLARFGTANEFSDWDTAHHVFTHANALHAILKRLDEAGDPYPDATAGVFAGAMALYLTRFLNIPPAGMPGEDGRSLNDLPEAAAELLDRLLAAFDRQARVSDAARLTSRYLLLGHDPEKLIVVLARALLREDAGFHAYQNLEAGVRQFDAWGPGDEGRHILVAVARFLAAHSPTERAEYQTADIALRLHRGGELHEEEDA